MAGNGPISQDWEPVVLRKKAPTAAAKKDEKAVNAARRSGADIETTRKCRPWDFLPWILMLLLFGSTSFLTLSIGVRSLMGVVYVSFAANAGTNKAASSSTSLNTRKLDEETENLSLLPAASLKVVLAN
ncbi:hypothetical protein BHM03_00020934 [Ensete ventricosum]|nr:hypothetical protein BHM03_00020934 [Ensete ventricosum]